MLLTRRAVRFTSSAASSPRLAALRAAPVGSLVVWGRVDDGRLGMRFTDADFSVADLASTGGPFVGPTVLTGLADVISVVARSSKTLALTADGAVWSWGTCENMSLGHGEKTTKQVLPKRVEALKGIRITRIAAGDTSSAAVSDEGELFTWGWGGSFWSGNGGLGHGNDVSQPAPALVEALIDAKVRISSISVGSAHMLALSTDGRVFSWGNCEYGRCGNGRSKQSSPAVVDVLAESAGGGRCIAVSSGPAHSFALDAAGDVWAWGKNEASQLGLGASLIADLNTMEEYPTRVLLDGPESSLSFNHNIAHIASGNSHAVALGRDGSVWQWGARSFLVPTRVPFANSAIFTDVATKSGAAAGAPSGTQPLKGVSLASGEYVSGVLDKSGALFTWSKGPRSEALGHPVGFLGNARVPSRVDAGDVNFSAVSIGSHHAAAIKGVPKIH